MDKAEFGSKIGLIRSDISLLESILPAGVVQAAIMKAETVPGNGDILNYQEIRTFKHTNAWIFRGLMKVLVPFRLVSRSLVSKRVTISFPALLYAIFLCVVWFILLQFQQIFLAVCVLTWLALILAALFPYLTAYYYLQRNKAVYKKVMQV